jgi:thiol:disulfide interchange protein DsbD
MRRTALSGIFLSLALLAHGQIFDPVKWQFSVEKISNSEFNLKYTATMDKGWYIYSQYLESDDGPVRTSFNYDAGSHFSLNGKSVETSDHRIELNDPLFDNMRVIKFSDKVVFSQKVKVTDPSKPITGYLEFMTCDHERCLPPKEVNFSFETGGAKAGDKQVAPAADKTAITPPAGQGLFPAAENAPVLGGVQNTEGIYNPVKWNLGVEKVTDREYRLVFSAAIEKGWYIYSQFIEPGGPEPTAFEFEAAEGLVVDGRGAERPQGGRLRRDVPDESYKIQGIRCFHAENQRSGCLEGCQGQGVLHDLRRRALPALHRGPL